MPEHAYEPRIEPWFWEIIEKSGHSLRALCRQLEALPEERLFSFQRYYQEAMEYVHPRDWDNPAIPEGFGCSEDSGTDFAEWVAGQGRDFYYLVRNHPERLDEFFDMFDKCDAEWAFPEMRWDEDVDREEYRGWQSPSAVGFAVFQARFGRDIFDAVRLWRE
jgi:hypothetical protein